MDLIQIKVTYNYYSSKRVTPVYMREEELENFSFDQFKMRILKEVPHLTKAVSLRWTVNEDEVQVDLSPLYFNYQVRGLLQKEKNIKINVIEFESPAACTSFSSREEAPIKGKISSTCSSTASTSRNVSIGKAHARRTLILNPVQNQDDLDTDGDTDEEIEAMEQPRIMLPLERYAVKQKETVDNISQELKTGIHELEMFDEKIHRASSQNMGNLSMCGKCHLKLGHTKKSCTFSPCKSAFSCGQLSKHADAKAQRVSIDKDIGRLRVKLTKAQKDVEDAGRAAERLNNSASKRIEDVVITEMPDRYVTNGLRNWSLLNRDVATLQKRLNGKLPSRENVQKLLKDIVDVTASKARRGKVYQRSSCTITNASPSIFPSETDHRMSSQKRLLSDDYAITFPKKRALPAASSIVFDEVCGSSSMSDFKLALKLQQEEMKSPQKNMTVSTTQIQVSTDPNAMDKEIFVSDDSDPLISFTPASERYNEDNIEFEADAAAALLQLKRRREPRS